MATKKTTKTQANDTQANDATPKRRKNKTGFTHIHQESRSFWFKFYAEQCGYVAPTSDGQSVPISAPNVNEQFKQTQILRNTLANIVANTSPDKYCMHAAVHYADKVAPNETQFWAPSIEKPHAHLLIWLPEKSHTGNRSGATRLNTILNYLSQFGLIYRPEYDTELLLNHGVERVDLRQKRHFNAVVYHSHETDEAQDEGKHRYDRKEMITNLSSEELNAMYDYYFSSISRVGKHDAEYYENEAFELGKNTILTTTEHRTFEEWFYSIPFKQRTETLRRQWERSYLYGQKTAIEDPAHKKQIRCFIFINGGPDAGKTHTTQLTLTKLVGRTYSVSSGKTGKLDNLEPTHKAIDVSDNSIPDLLALADNVTVPAYRRNSGNPYFTGQYLVVSFNGSLDDYLDRFYGDICTDADRANPDGTRSAFHSRCFECVLKDGKLDCVSPSLRGTESDIRARTTLFLNFVDEFERQIQTYNPSSIDKMSIFNEMTAGRFSASSQPATATPEAPTRRMCPDLGQACMYRSDALFCNAPLNLVPCPLETPAENPFATK